MLNHLIAIACLLALPAIGEAKKLFKYQDEQGRWHYTDKEPEAPTQQMQVRQMKVNPKQWVFLEKNGNEANPDFYLLNKYPGPVEVDIDWQKRENAEATPTLPRRFTVEPGKSASLFSVGGIDANKGWQFTLQYRYTIGAPLSNYQSTTPYFPPMAPGAQFQISQAFGGEFSHNDPQNQFAVDIVMPLDTPVHAARDGVVLEVNDDFYQSGTQKAYANKANSIRVLHDDGSMAIYAHLALEKAQVQTGSSIKTGQLIGYSGNTGFSSGPHLHFSVQINRGMELVSVPFKFIDISHHIQEPIPGQWLKGFRAD